MILLYLKYRVVKFIEEIPLLQIFIYNNLKIDYFCYIYDIEKNNLRRLQKNDIRKLKMGKILEKKYSKNSVNIFYINKNKKIKHN